MRILSLLFLLFLSTTMFSQKVGDCLQTIYDKPVEVETYQVVELEPARYETYIKVPAVVKTVKVSEAIYEWKEKDVLVRSAYTDYEKSNCGSEAGCSWKKVAVPAKYQTIRYKVIIPDAMYEDVIVTPAQIGRREISKAIVTKIKVTTITDNGKVSLKNCN